jgi:prepilin-type N-terminal cleavage/methylation domain-containing protein
MLEKLRKSRKGFTLIELIVVIAILAILAIIAIPRFAGFTDKAKIAADDQYVALLGNAATVLLADGTITAIGTITIAQAGTLTLTGLTGATAQKFMDLVKTTPLRYFTSVVITVTNLDGTYTKTYTPAHP